MGSNQAFIPMGSEIEKEVMKRSGFDLQQESSKLVEEEIVQQDDVIAEQAMEESSRTTGGRRKKSLARKRARETLSEESAKKQKLEDDTEKEELQVYLNIVPEEESLDIESLATKYPIVDLETQILANDKYYYQIKRADGSVKHYKIFSTMLYDFDRQDVLELYRLVKERFQTTSSEVYDLLLWGDLKTLIEPDEEDEIWRNQQDWNLINSKLHNFCRVHVLLMETGLVIHMMVEKKYPLSQDNLSKMLSRRLKVDHQSDMGYELISIVETDYGKHDLGDLYGETCDELRVFGMRQNELDKETGSSDGLQPKQADLSYVHALNEPHLHEIHVVPSKHEADQC
ncbi:hypothetical protein Tco_0639161 [Tanacetum coccineum]